MSDFDTRIILQWYNELESDKGGRAELRRAHNPTEVVFLPVYHRLYTKLEVSNPNKEALACVAGLCAHVKENQKDEFAKQMAKKISSLRFRKLLAINDREDLYHMMIRVIRQLGGKVDVTDLAKIVYWWNEKTKKDLAYEYYANASSEK